MRLETEMAEREEGEGDVPADKELERMDENRKKRVLLVLEVSSPRRALRIMAEMERVAVVNQPLQPVDLGLAEDLIRGLMYHGVDLVEAHLVEAAGGGE